MNISFNKFNNIVFICLENFLKKYKEKINGRKLLIKKPGDTI